VHRHRGGASCPDRREGTYPTRRLCAGVDDERRAMEPGMVLGGIVACKTRGGCAEKHQGTNVF